MEFQKYRSMKENKENKQKIQISVRNLVEFILREGDIDQRKGRPSDKEAMQKGSRVHRKIQRSMGAEYQSEVSLKIEYEREQYVLQIEGRADGVQIGEVCLIDEIKGVYRALEKIEKPIEAHLAQAKCYAYVYGMQKQLDELDVQVTYCHMETEEIKRFQTRYTLKELEAWFLDIVQQYEKWITFQVEWQKKRNESIRRLSFPYEYRMGQKDVAGAVYRTIARNKKLFVQAPTGVGKTMATVFPTIKAVGEGLGEKLFYLTAKTITKTVAENAFTVLKENGLQYKIITLTAKEKICLCEKAECNPDQCPYAKGHFDRVNEAVYDLITTTSDMDRAHLIQYAQKHQVCPFEMALDASLWVDAVICDYNYVFDPNVHLKRYFSEGKKGKYLFLIDEAHNLVERGREMYSATLYKEDFLQLRGVIKEKHPKLAKQLSACNQNLLEWKRECEQYQLKEDIGNMVLRFMNVIGEMERILEEDVPQDEFFLEFYFALRHFLNTYDMLDEHYRIYTEMEESGKFKLKLFCVNPATRLSEYLQQGVGTVFFSATLLPILYYKQLLSVEVDDYAIYAESPFDSEHRLLWIGTDVSTKYTLRGKTMYEKYADYIRKMVTVKKGNYLVFFPSYRFMESVKQALLTELLPDVDLLYQEQYMTEQEKETFLDAFREARENTLLGFSVLGGVFSEGIDLTREDLIGVAVVGTGIPQMCNEREILRQYFDRQNGNGYGYAYLYPGMNKVQQAAGRVIRTECDKGIILLLDERFRGKQHLEIFPREWHDVKQGNLQTIEEEIKKFWMQI